MIAGDFQTVNGYAKAWFCTGPMFLPWVALAGMLVGLWIEIETTTDQAPMVTTQAHLAPQSWGKTTRLPQDWG